MNDVLLVLAIAASMVCLTAFLTSLHNTSEESGIHRKLKDGLSGRSKRRLMNEWELRRQFGETESRNLITHLDRLLLRSGLAVRFLKLTTELALILCALSSIGICVLISILFNVLAGVGAAILLPMLCYLVLRQTADHRMVKSEAQMSQFVGILSNQAVIYDDIVTIMEQIWPHLSDPLRSIVRRFVNKARDSGSVDTAFSHMRESIESRQLRSILTNLQTTSHFNADYRGILRVISVDMNDYLRGINERSAMIRRFKVEFLIIFVLFAILLLAVTRILGNSFGALTETFIGKLILTGVIGIWTVICFKCLITERA